MAEYFLISAKLRLTHTEVFGQKSVRFLFFPLVWCNAKLLHHHHNLSLQVLISLGSCHQVLVVFVVVLVVFAWFQT